MNYNKIFIFHLQGLKTSTVLKLNNNAPVILDSLQYNSIKRVKNKLLY